MHFYSDNPALRSQLETQVNFMNEFSQKALDTLRQLSEMNLKLARQTIEGTITSSREMLSCTDPVQLTQVAMRQLQPAGERLRAYQQQLMTVMAGAQAQFAHAAESGIPEASRSASAIADEMVRHAAVAANLPVTSPAATAAPSPVTGNGSAEGTTNPS